MKANTIDRVTAMHKIFDGIETFQRDVFPQRKELFAKLANGQEPEVLFITCADSRVDPNLITQTDPGELFICRNAGNIVPPHTGATGGMTASIEYAVGALNIPHIIICGHSNCGAMGGAMAPEKLDRFPHVRNWLTFSQAALQAVDEKYPDADDHERLHRLIEQNVLMQMQHIKTHPHVAARLASKKVQLHGWVYDIETGEVRAYDEERDAFAPLGSAEPARKSAVI